VTLWRISNHRRLDGGGGLLAPGRWHTRGSRIVYCSPNPATALAEVLVHVEIDPGDLPDPLQYLEIHAPDTVSMETVDFRALGRQWRSNEAATRDAGDRWLQAGNTAVLRVPSAIVPATWNLLVNPRHPESAQMRIVHIHSHGIDPRLL